MSNMCFSGVSDAVSGTMSFFSFLSALSSSGWRAFLRFIRPSSEMTGIPAMKSSATCAFAIMKSISPK